MTDMCFFFSELKRRLKAEQKAKEKVEKEKEKEKAEQENVKKKTTVSTKFAEEDISPNVNANDYSLNSSNSS